MRIRQLRQRAQGLGALSISPLLAARIALGAFGVWVASIGLRALLRGHPFAANAPVGRWLAGGVLAHDAVIAPTVFVLGAITARLAGPRTRQALAAILLIGGSVLIVGLPDVLRKGHNANPTVTPLDYKRNLLIVLLAVVGGVVLVTGASVVRQRRRERAEADVEADIEGEAEAEAEAGAEIDAADDEVSDAEAKAGVPESEDDGSEAEDEDESEDEVRATPESTPQE